MGQKVFIVDTAVDSLDVKDFDPMLAMILAEVYYISIYKDGDSINPEDDVFDVLDSYYLNGFEMPDDFQKVVQMMELKIKDKLAEKYSLLTLLAEMENYTKEKLDETAKEIEKLEVSKSNVLGKLESIV